MNKKRQNIQTCYYYYIKYDYVHELYLYFTWNMMISILEDVVGNV